jgi:hypothetical protein
VPDRRPPTTPESAAGTDVILSEIYELPSHATIWNCKIVPSTRSILNINITITFGSFFCTTLFTSIMRFFFLLLSGASLAAAFVPKHLSAPALVASKTTHSRLNAMPDVTAMETSRAAFFLWFFGASGGAGIARSAFPRMYKSAQNIKSLKGEGSTLGGETLGLSPLCGYPEDLALADIKKILSNKLNVEQLVEKFPVEGNFLSAKGYLTFKAFQEANQNENPLAVRAIFDSLASSTDVCSPDIAQAKFDSYIEDPSLIAAELLKAKAVGFSSIFTLLFLLGLADVTAFGHANSGWFPAWPGITNFPVSFIDDLKAIPTYWIGETSSILEKLN